MKGTCWVNRLRGSHRGRDQVRIGAPDPSLTPAAGLLAVTELVNRVGITTALDEAVGPIKQRARGLTGGEFIVGLACAQLAGEDCLVGLDRRRADTAGESLAPVPTAPSTTAATLAKRFDTSKWRAAETAIGRVAGRVIGHVGQQRREALLASPTLDLDATDVEVYGSHKQGVSYNYKGQRAGRPHLATWAEAGIVLAADLLAGDEDPRAGVVDLLDRALAGLAAATDAHGGHGRVRVRGDIGYFTKDLADAVIAAGADFAIGANRNPATWRRRVGARGRLDRRRRHGRRPGRGRRLHARRLAGRHPMPDPSGSPRGCGYLSRPPCPTPQDHPGRPAHPRAGG